MRLLIVGDSPALMTGQARMVRELAYRFVEDGVEIVVAGWFHNIAQSRFVAPYEILHTDKKKPETIDPILQTVLPDAVLVIGDAWEFSYLAKLRAEGAKWLFYGYLNFEYDEHPPHIEHVLDAFDDWRATSGFGAHSTHRPDAQYVHLGVDARQFRPGPRPARILGRELEDDTLVIFVNAQNRPRKNLPGAIAAIGQLTQKINRPVLGVFNCQPLDPGGSNLATEMVRWDLEDSIVFNTGNRGPNQTTDDEALAQFYEAADLYLVVSSSEGFCLPVLEAMTSRTLVVGPQSYTMPELLGGRATGLRPGSTLLADRGVLFAPGALTISGLGGWVRLPDVEDAALGLETAAALLQTPEAKATLDRAQEWAATKTWAATYQGIAEMIAPATPKARWPMPKARVADGGVVDPLLRWRGRQRSADRIGVVRMGGLGDMLMATRVIREAAKKYDRKVTVFANSFTDVFDAMPEVEDIVEIRGADQSIVVRSVADEFDLCLDLRLPSRAYGSLAPAAPPLATAFAWMTDYGVFSYSRLGQLGRHVVQIMLESLDLPLDNLTPIYEPRAELESDVSDSIIIAPGTGDLGPLKKPEASWWAEFVEKCGRRVVQIGGFDDALVPGAYDARGWGFPVTATLIERARQCVMVESGMAHLARAVRPVDDRHRTVVLFGPTPLQAYGYPEHVNLTKDACQPCFWGPLWTSQKCAIGQASCVNLPTLHSVLRQVAK